MMIPREIGIAASYLANMLRSSITLAQALDTLIKLQPHHAETWRKAVDTVKSGHPLSQALAGEWPDEHISALEAGEHSGKLEDVLEQIKISVKLQTNIGNLLKKLIYPLSIAGVGIVAFVLFMVFTIPNVGRSLGGRRPDAILSLAYAMESFFHAYWLPLLAGFGVALVALVTWARTEAAKNLFLGLMLRTPLLGEAIRNLYFGMWAQYVALLADAGIVITKALMIPLKVLPTRLHDGVITLVEELESNAAVSDALDSESVIDDRAQWPIYITNALIVGEQTGRADRLLREASPSLVDDGMEQFNRAMNWLSLASLALAGFLIALPMAAYYSQVFSGISTVGR